MNAKHPVHELNAKQLLEERILQYFPLTITESALKKANLYARLNEHNGELYEAYLFMSGDASKSSIQDVILAREQFMEKDRCYLTYDGKIHRKELILSGIPIIGWCHTHAAYPNFFSSLDIQNAKEFTTQDGGRNVLIGSQNIHLYYHLVVNGANDPPYGAIGYRIESKHRDHEVCDILLDVPVKVIPDNSVSLQHNDLEAKEQLDHARCTPGKECYDRKDPMADTSYGQTNVNSPSSRITRKIVEKKSNETKKEEISEPTKNIEEILGSDQRSGVGGDEAHIGYTRVDSKNRMSYSSCIKSHEQSWKRNPAFYSPGFGSLLGILRGNISRNWNRRAVDIIVHYVNHIPTTQEFIAVKQVLHSNRHLRKKCKPYYNMLNSFLEVRYATSKTAPTVGKTETEPVRECISVCT